MHIQIAPFALRADANSPAAVTAVAPPPAVGTRYVTAVGVTCKSIEFIPCLLEAVHDAGVIAKAKQVKITHHCDLFRAY